MRHQVIRETVCIAPNELNSEDIKILSFLQIVPELLDGNICMTHAEGRSHIVVQFQDRRTDFKPVYRFGAYF